METSADTWLYPKHREDVFEGKCSTGVNQLFTCYISLYIKADKRT